MEKDLRMQNVQNLKNGILRNFFMRCQQESTFVINYENYPHFLMFTMGIFSCNNLDRSSRLGNSMEGDVCQIMLPNSLHYPERYKFVMSTFLEILSLKFEILDMKFVVFG